MMKVIGSDFVWTKTPETTRCSECGKEILRGQKALVSRKNGVVRKRVCSDDCRQTFDARFWLMVADRKHPEGGK